MQKITQQDLMSLEEYAKQRDQFRSRVLAHKKNRKVALGENASLYFEDRLTMHYQIQEMLRVEKIFEQAAILEELDAYNPLIPDGYNFKATFMIEYCDTVERQQALQKLMGVEDKVYVQIDGFDKVYAIADEDMPRNNQQKTSAVHFMRFELGAEISAAAKKGFNINIGVEHENLSELVKPLPAAIQQALVADLE